MDLQLRDECKNLLNKLKSSQKCMKENLQLATQSGIQSNATKNNFLQNENNCASSSNFGEGITGQANVDYYTNSSLKSIYARNKLSSLNRFTDSAKIDVNSDLRSKGDKENQINFSSNKVEIENINKVDDFRDKTRPTTDSLYDCDTNAYDGINYKFVSPTRSKKRQLIDRHTPVETKLNSKELQELNDERLLNFTYSHINTNRNCDIKSLSDSNLNEISDNLSSKNDDTNSDVVIPAGDAKTKTFQTQLQDTGNDRRLNGLIREMTIKPKTILNSTDYYNLSKRGLKLNSKVKFNTTESEDVSMGDPRLLGYDWIAALLDNERNMVDQSESFFDEICDFRKAFKEECNNKFYTESPYTLVDSEPEPVVEALTEPKVRPFIVNNRLFTEPLSSNLFDDEAQDRKTSSKEPSKDNPRFVRVSIPRSTLATPYRVKPHRRSSFDGSDSCSLVDHCLLGWENTVPSAIPPAKSLSLAADAGTQINSQTTTLAEAERLATAQNQVHWHLSRPNPQSQVLPRWRKHYMDLTLNYSLPTAVQKSANTTLTLNQSRGSSADVKRKTDKILQATYSTMYEMERLRQKREMEKLEKV